MRPDLSPQAGALDPIETASRDEIAALQLGRLRQTLAHAYTHVPHYRQAFEAHGVHPDDLRRLDDIGRFPFTTKADLRANYPFGMFAVPREQIRRIHASSGTTGKPTVVGYTQGDLEMWAEVMARSIRAAGGRAGMRVHVAYGYGLFTGGLGAHYGAERLGCAVIPMSGGQTERQVQLIQDFEPDIIMVTPSYMLAILGRVPGCRGGSAVDLAESRDFRRRTVDRRDAGRDRGGVRHACGRHLRAFRGDRGPGSRASASRARMGCISGRTISIRRWSTR